MLVSLGRGLARPRRLNAPATPPAITPLQIAETQGRVITSWLSAGSGHDRHAVYQPMYVPYANTHLAVLMQGWVWKQFTNGYYDIPNALGILKMWIECPNGNVITVKWSDGRTHTLTPGDNNRVSDEISAAEAGYSVFPAGTYILKAEMSLPTGGSYPFVNNQHNVVSWTYAAANTTLTNSDSAGALTYSGAAPATGNVGYKPILLGRPTSANAKTFLCLGDSIADGAADSAASDIHGNGFVQRAAGNSGTNSVPMLGFNSFGGRAWWLANWGDANIGKWTALIQYANTAIIEVTTNDLDSYADEYLEAHMRLIWAALDNGGIETKIQVPLLAATNSTDNWATSGNQSALSANWGAATSRRSSFNALLASEIGSDLDYLVDVSAVLDATDNWKWKTNGAAKHVNDDQVHPNATGHGLLAAALRAVINAVIA